MRSSNIKQKTDACFNYSKDRQAFNTWVRPFLQKYMLESLICILIRDIFLSVRSFDNTRSETIQFHTPLTLIVGYNGSGKTVGT